jgi:hypothetical protein
MAFKKKGLQELDARLNLRLPQAERDSIEHDADLSGISMSEMVRSRYFGRKIVAHADEVMIRELRRTGGLLKSVHLESGGAYSKETATLLNQLGRLIDKISAGK